MEDPVPFEQKVGVAGLLAGLQIILGLFDRLTIDTETGFSAGIDAASFCMDLVPGQPFSGLAEQELVQRGVSFPGRITDSHCGTTDPWLVPGDNALIYLFDDSVGDHLINILVFHDTCDSELFETDRVKEKRKALRNGCPARREGEC